MIKKLITVLLIVILFIHNSSAQEVEEHGDQEDRIHKDIPFYLDKIEGSYAAIVYEFANDVSLNLERTQNGIAIFNEEISGFTWKVKLSSKALNYRLTEIKALNSEYMIPVGAGLEFHLDFGNVLFTKQQKSENKSTDIGTYLKLDYLIASPVIYINISDKSKLFYQIANIGFMSLKGTVNFGHANDLKSDNEKIDVQDTFFDPWVLNQRGKFGWEFRGEKIVWGMYSTNQKMDLGVYSVGFEKFTFYAGFAFGNW